MNHKITKHKLEFYRELQELEDRYQEKMRKSKRYAKITFALWLIMSALLIYKFAI